jgi:hypothetical protein
LNIPGFGRKGGRGRVEESHGGVVEGVGGKRVGGERVEGKKG